MAAFVSAILLLSLCSIHCCSGEKTYSGEMLEKIDSAAVASFNTNTTSERLQQLEALMKLLSEEVNNVRVDQERMRQDVLIRLEVIDEKLKDYGPTGRIERLMATYMKDFRPVQNNTKVAKDCLAALKDGWTESGVFTVSPDGGASMELFCDQKSHGGGWTVVQRRQDGRVDFGGGWEEYKLGFGDLVQGEFWLGNEHLHRLTSGATQKLRVQLHRLGHGYTYAEYSFFVIGSEEQKYKLHIGGYTGTNSPGDSLEYHNGQLFSTPDTDNDADSGHCAARYGAGWWFRNCSTANLNGVYGSTSERGITWSSWLGTTTSLTSVKMMVKPADKVIVGKDCQEVYANGGTRSGVYTITPGGTKVQVFCEQELQGGGWTVLQRRVDGSTDFYRGWAAYKLGFGDPSGEYWVGNDNLYLLTANQDTQLLVELQHGGETVYAPYKEFWVGSEKNNYTLHVSGYAGGRVPDDCLNYPHNGRPFTTRDRDNDAWDDGNCAQQSLGAWWYNKCYESNLNGVYNKESTQGIIWYRWKGWFTSMSATRMMLKTKQ